MDITISLLFVFKIFAAIFAEGFMAMLCLWPINDKPTSKGQFVFFGIISIVFIAWLFNWLSFNFTMN